MVRHSNEAVMATTDLLKNKVRFDKTSLKTASLLTFCVFIALKVVIKKQGIMNTEVVKVLKSWKSSIDHDENFHIQ